ncbi:hypothetical protein [Deinococcus sp.]|uniref:hypothetical protein n=1 Tax=Deinococcus sp. TaxID=47478 RepID=UPI003C7DF4C6
MSDSPHEAIPQTGTDKSEQVNIPQTAEPQLQGRQDAHPTEPTPNLQSPPESARNRGEDALDVALQGSMITSDPPSSLMEEED